MTITIKSPCKGRRFTVSDGLHTGRRKRRGGDTGLKALTRQDTYRSPQREVGWFRRCFPSLAFYAGIVSIVVCAARLAKRGRYHAAEWIESSIDTVELFESIGGRLVLENLSLPANGPSPCVFVGNHMSVLETFIFPCLIRPHREVTFVIKESLVAYPAFKHVMVTRDPIVVGRKDPRQDLKTVLEEGQERLGRGMSVIIFPQTTRSAEFDPRKFNSLGIKLAKRAGVPVIPFALKTDAWGVGSRLKDFGWIRPQNTVHICFGQPLAIDGPGKLEHQRVVDFIAAKLNEWANEQAVPQFD